MLQFLLFSSCLLILLAVSGIKQVNAQTDTPEPPLPTNTPTPTFVPIFSPPDEVEIDYTCPGYQPEGWGTVTPSAWWYMNCARCVTPQAPGEEWDWGDNPIQTTETVTPTEITTTPVAGNLYPYLYYSGTQAEYPPKIEFTVSDPISTTSEIVFEGYVTIRDQPINQNFYLNYSISANMNKPWNESGYYYLISKIKCFSDSCIITNEGVTTELTFNTSATIWQSANIPSNSAQIITNEITNLEVTIINATHQSTEKGFYLWTETENGSVAAPKGTLTTTITWDSIPIGTPTYFCSNVQDGGEYGVGSPDDVFSIPIIAAGEGTCLQFFSATIPLSWLEFVWDQAQDLKLPAFNLCFKPISFGELKLFGMSINMDLLAYAMAGVVLIRILTRS